MCSVKDKIVSPFKTSQLTIAINNVSSIRADAEREIHSESENLEIIIYTTADEVE